MSRAQIVTSPIRKSFAKIQSAIRLPNLIEVQSNSFNNLVQLDSLPSERKNIGLESIFKNTFPIEYSDKMSLEYIEYELGNWKCSCGELSGINTRYTWKCNSCKIEKISKIEKDTKCSSCKSKDINYIICKKCSTRVEIKPEVSMSECRISSQTLSLPLRIKVQLVSWNKEAGSSKKTIRDVKEQSIFLLDMPVMGDIYEENGIFKLGSTGTFVFNGVERVVVSQIHRAPGVVFTHNKKSKDTVNPYSNYIAKIIPMRGSWIDFEVDNKNILYVRIDKARKILATTLLQALGIKREDIVKTFYSSAIFQCSNKTIKVSADKNILGTKIEKGMLPKNIEKKFLNKEINEQLLEKIRKEKVGHISLSKDNVINNILLDDVFDPTTGELIAHQGSLINESIYKKLIEHDNIKFLAIRSFDAFSAPIISLTLSIDKCFSQESAVKEVYSKVFSGETAPYEDMKNRLLNMFFNSNYYNITKSGRLRINRKLSLSIPEDTLHLTIEDIVETVKYLIKICENDKGKLDDIDNLGNRRIRLVGELLSNQFYTGMMRLEKIARERFRMYDSNKALAPYDLINVKPLTSTVREFFATGQLSQFMDQTNPLAEIAHKRRISSLGPGGIVKERATYEIRDVHTSHYGRICPIETPEGQSIGLISSLATLAHVNELGFIETPYRKVIDGNVTDEVVYLDAFEESHAYIAQIESLVDNNKIKKSSKILARHDGNFVYVDYSKIDYIDLSSNQLFSVATALIPFLQHDDAVRALMGSNMQRQAVPLVKSENPIVGTGIEREVAKASGDCILSKYSGIIEYVSAEKIIVKSDESQFSNTNEWIQNSIKEYNLRVFEGSSYNTCIHQKPCVKVGDKVSAGQMITNSSAIIDQELALGKNLLVGFMAWRGFNYEDAIILNKRVVSDDLLTSIKIEEYSVDARDTRLGPEEITADIPNVSSSALRFLDSSGIVKVGTRVKSGDILVGKITLKGDVQHSPEEKLLRAIFGDKSRDVKDTSLRVPAGVEGIVTDIKVFSRSGPRNDDRYKECIAKKAQYLKQDLAMHKSKLSNLCIEKILTLAKEYATEKKDKKILQKIEEHGEKREISVESTASFISKISSSLGKRINIVKNAFDIQMQVLDVAHNAKLSTLRRGDTLPVGVLKMVKVYIASIRHMQVGDKMSGRHGNKGVVSLILPREDMPFMKDGTPLDVILNPIGVPARMNIGQILETILGFAGKKLGEKFAETINTKRSEVIEKELSSIYGKEFIEKSLKEYGEEWLYELAKKLHKRGVYFSTPVFDSGNFDETVKPMLEKANLPISGTHRLRDGLTGEYFDQKATVGIMYMMKLNHMVDDKLHARSVGPYSLVTQQPLGGKAQKGGQRFGEMEVWALEAHGAAYTLQELLTYKSDDVSGRHKVYDSIVRGENIPTPGMPESFNVLVKELQSLSLKVDLFSVDKGCSSE
jgi:DNA-directed RNA polymerase subunit beta